MKRIFLYTSLTLTALALTATASSPEPVFRDDSPNRHVELPSAAS